jgi:hypothetical protein
MNRLIYQVSVGKPSNLYKHCIQSVAEYCVKHDIKHYVLNKPKLRINPNPFTSNRSEGASRLGYLPIFEKENAFDLLPKYDQIAVVDSDIYIRSDAPNIFDDFGTDHPFGAVCEREMPINKQYIAKILNYSRMQYHGIHGKKGLDFKPNKFGYEFYNMGLMLMNQSFYDYVKMPAKEWVTQSEFQPFIDGLGAWKWSTDQTLLNYFMKSRKVPVKHINWKWNGLYTANTKISECHFIHFFLKDKLPERGENVQQLMEQI